MKVQRLKLDAETGVALAGTVFSALLLVLTALYAGPLWRDETNTFNLARMPSLQEFWHNLAFESFPPLWPLLVRGYSQLGLADSDAGVRVLGLFVGWFFLAALWSASRWVGARAPTLSLALLACLPAFVFITGANRAYGLANGLLVLSFGLIWRVVESPSKLRCFCCGIVCLLFAHCVYYDIVFLGAMLSGAAIVVIRRRQWPTLAALAGLGLVSAASLAIYLPVIRRGSAYVAMNRDPLFSLATVWNKLGATLSARSSAQNNETAGPEIWLWLGLLLLGVVVALSQLWASKRQPRNPPVAVVHPTRSRADLTWYCAVSMILGTAGCLVFLVRLHYVTQPWYYLEMLTLCALSLDGLLNVPWPALRPWGLLRIGFMVVMMVWYSAPAWREAHTRRSNVDLLASALGQVAGSNDLIIVEGAWEGITFNRYYRGRAPWATVPPIDSHLVHRNDLVLERMSQPDPMASVLSEITDALRGGNNVWVVGNMVVPRTETSPAPAPPTAAWLSTYFRWSEQVTRRLQAHALEQKILVVPTGGPVNRLEDLPVRKFSGYQPGPD